MEEDSLRLIGYGREILSRYISKSFFALCAGQKTGKSGEIPILVYNPLQYEIDENIEAEFQLEDQNWNDEYTIAEVYDENGQRLPSQNEKADGSINLDWRKKVTFKAVLKPMSINRFDCVLKVIKGGKCPIAPYVETDTHFEFANDRMKIKINKTTGLLDEYIVGGVSCLNKGGMRITAYKDNEDPWGMNVDGYYEMKGEFQGLMVRNCQSKCVCHTNLHMRIF